MKNQKDGAIIVMCNIGKAMTEKSSLQESSREDSDWWKLSMRNVYENHSRAVMPKMEKTIVKHYRAPALKDRICWNLK